MAKKDILGFVKLQVPGGAANPGGGIGPALGSKGLNIMDFCNQFNARTQDKKGDQLSVLITIYKDKSFDFVIKSPPATNLLKKLSSVKKGSPESNRKKIGTITWSQIKEIAETKMKDLNAFTIEKAMNMIAGSARSMGLTVSGKTHTNNK